MKKCNLCLKNSIWPISQEEKMKKILNTCFVFSLFLCCFSYNARGMNGGPDGASDASSTPHIHQYTASGHCFTSLNEAESEAFKQAAANQSGGAPSTGPAKGTVPAQTGSDEAVSPSDSVASAPRAPHLASSDSPQPNVVVSSKVKRKPSVKEIADMTRRNMRVNGLSVIT